MPESLGLALNFVALAMGMVLASLFTGRWSGGMGSPNPDGHGMCLHLAGNEGSS